MPPPPTSSPTRNGFPSWAWALIACVVAGPLMMAVCGVIAAITVPALAKYDGKSQSEQAKTNLDKIWLAEKSWAAAHGGDYLEFDIEIEDQSDPSFQQLGVSLDKPLHHAYSAFYIGPVLWITANGNVDEDSTMDDWELSSTDPTPLHTSNDVTEEMTPSKQPTDDGYEGTTEPGGVIGGIVGGAVSPVATPDLGKLIEITARSMTADQNLSAIYAAEKKYQASHKRWLFFTEGSATTWTALGIKKLPAKENHKYAAKADGTKLMLSAVGNLDDDEYEDEWILSSDDATPVQLKSDALNLDLSKLAGTP